jgi:hypothetical protein
VETDPQPDVVIEVVGLVRAAMARTVVRLDRIEKIACAADAAMKTKIVK